MRIHRTSRRAARGRGFLSLIASAALLVGMVPAGASAADASYPDTSDPRYSLTGDNTAGKGMELLAHVPRQAPLNTSYHSDMAFTRDHVIQGHYNGFNVIDVSNPAKPVVKATVLCPGGQGDVNVHGNLMFTSVEQTSGRVDCGSQGAGNANTPNPERMRGVRIWDISDLTKPRQVAVIQTCRGSHTNRLVEDPNDPDHVYIYNNGTSSQRNVNEAVHTPNGFEAGRCQQTSATSPNPSQWMIEIIKVPVKNPAAAEVVKEWRLFADEETGAVNGLQNGPTRSGHPCSTTPNPANPASNSCSPAGTGYSPSPNTNTCHDITVYPEIGLAAGACQGNGILIDISNPADPVRLDVASDENFSYWHSANFNNDGTTVMFTDEWGGGGGARCMPHHRMEWGANAIFTIDRSGPKPQLEFQSYYKLPAAQNTSEICVAHQANILPVPGRDIAVQAWYSGGASMFDFTDPANPREIGYFDYGNGDGGEGYWSAYWYNGQAYGNGIIRGLDVLKVNPTADLTANELAAARTVKLAEHNAMSMRQYVWEPSFEVVRAHLDQVKRDGDIKANKLANVEKMVDKAQEASGKNAKNAIAQLRAASNQLDTRDPWQAKLHAALQSLMADLA
ncbi:hypothetical protein GCM10009584_18260 [Ornithinimicrobium humiphilum]|uniref:LVIVD repeat-containing protein n=1 Tax=Ornithinimicrobium humiphilum TaxID=125288 RepID=A0A543KLG2_9MICO|nr:hypothetical protein [Ornithinimicrobium humiphilum]TQM95918.1 LVIVD repeat-containing protein [Ornithinimicrobium humiphilum]